MQQRHLLRTAVNLPATILSKASSPYDQFIYWTEHSPLLIGFEIVWISLSLSRALSRSLSVFIACLELKTEEHNLI